MNVLQMQETLAQYFSRRDTPMAGSPVGTLMVRVMQKYPQLSFDEAKARAKDLLSLSAKARTYRTPHVLSVEELANRAEQLRKAFPKASTGKTAALLPS